MVFTRKREIGRRIEEIQTGEKLTLTEIMEDKHLLLYLGLTNDSNPLYIQHDYVSQTPYKRPIVPSAMLTGIITSSVSKYLPGPGSYILKQEIEFIKPVYHYETVRFIFEVIAVDYDDHCVIITVIGVNEEGHTVIKGKMNVSPPNHIEGLESKMIENF